MGQRSRERRQLRDQTGSGLAALPDGSPGSLAPTDITDPALVASHAAVRSWVSLGEDRAAPSRLTLLLTKAKSHVVVLHGAIGDGMMVVGKSCSLDTSSVERLLYERVLPEINIAAPRFFGFAGSSDGPSWMFLEHIGDGEFDMGSVEHRSALIGWLAALHGFEPTDEISRALPDRGYECHLERLRDAVGIIDQHRGNPALTPSHHETLSSLVNKLETLATRRDDIAEICDRMPRCIVHGDLTTKHLRIRDGQSAPEFITFDWEHAGVGYPGTDLSRASKMWERSDFEMYGQLLSRYPQREAAANVDLIALMGKLLHMMTAVWWATGEIRDQYVRRGMSTMELYDGQLGEALTRMGW